MLGDYETSSVHACRQVGECRGVCVCHIFKSSFMSHSVMKISSPNLQRMFMAVKNMSGKFRILNLKNNMSTIANCSKIIDKF